MYPLALEPLLMAIFATYAMSTKNNGNNSLFSFLHYGDEKKKAQKKLENKTSKKLGELLGEMTIEEFITLINEQMANNAKKVMLQVNENLDAIYTRQLAAAQDFVNGDPEINIHTLRELMRELLPENYAKAIKKIKPGQSAKTIVQIYGGNNQLNAGDGEQNNKEW